MQRFLKLGTHQEGLTICLCAVIVVHPCSDDPIKFYYQRVLHSMVPLDFVSFQQFDIILDWQRCLVRFDKFCDLGFQLHSRLNFNLSFFGPFLALRLIDNYVIVVHYFVCFKLVFVVSHSLDK